MDEPRTVPTVSASDAEEFFTTGQSLYQHSSCTCGGIDVPGIGLVHTAYCTSSRLTLPALQVAPAENALRRMLRDELVSELIDAAHQIALQNMPRQTIALRKFISGAAPIFQHCRECGVGSIERNVIPHLPYCNTGRALALIAELKELQSNPTEKEAASIEEARAGDGMRPRGNFGEPWRVHGFDPRRERVFLGAGEGIATQVLEISGTFPNALDYARRAVACVNACAHLDESELQLLGSVIQYPDEPEAAEKGGAQ
jgi:hypothetical protein